MASNRWEKLRLRLRYGNLGEDDFRELLQSALREAGRAKDSALSRLILEEGLELRPTINGDGACPPDDMHWKYWLAMGMRYFPALVENSHGSAKSNTVANVRDWIEHDRELALALLFGNRPAVYAVLESGFDSDDWRKQVGKASSDQSLILDIVRYHVSSMSLSERQVGNWTNELLDDWAERIHRRLHVGVLQWLSEATKWGLGRLSGADNPADPAMFEAYMERFREATLDWAYGQALSYYNELKRRYRQAGHSASWIASGGVLAVAAMACMIAAWLLGAPMTLRLALAGAAVLSLGLVGFHLVRVFTILLALSGTVDAQLQTLEELAALYLPETRQ